MNLHHTGEFFLAGSSILPGFLLLAGEPGLAALSFTGLLVSGAVCLIGDPEAPHRKRPPS